MRRLCTEVRNVGSYRVIRRIVCRGGEVSWLYVTNRGERPRIGVAGAACQATVRQSSPTASSSRSR